MKRKGPYKTLFDRPLGNTIFFLILIILFFAFSFKLSFVLKRASFMIIPNLFEPLTNCETQGVTFYTRESFLSKIQIP